MNNTKKDLEEIYWRMKRIRLVEERIAEKYSEGKMRCPTHLSIGQEALPSTLGSIITKEDTSVSTHRCHAHYLAKGGDLKRMIAEIYGKNTGCSKGKGGSMHLIDKSCGFMGSSAIVGNSIAVGVGIGLSFKIRRTRDISIVYFGEGATEEGIFYESVNFAILRKLNVLFVCENNMYSVYSPMDVRQPKSRSIIGLTREMGMKTSLEVDEKNIETLVNKLTDIIENIRNGTGPALIHCPTYRWREHCGPNYDDELGYRKEEELKLWKANDPMTKLEKDIEKLDNNFGKKKKDKIGKINQEIDEAFDYAEKSEYPDRAEAVQEIYAESQ